MIAGKIKKRRNTWIHRNPHVFSPYEKKLLIFSGQQLPSHDFPQFKNSTSIQPLAARPMRRTAQ
jgi:hypothetical protein